VPSRTQTNLTATMRLAMNNLDSYLVATRTDLATTITQITTDANNNTNTQ